MKKLLLGLALILGAEGAAQACSCIPNAHDPVAMRELVDQFASRAVALVEVEVVAGFDPETRLGELVRVHRVLAGEAPAEFRIERGGRFPDPASCQTHYLAGERRYVLIFPPIRPVSGGTPGFGDQGYCASFVLGAERLREMLIETMGRPRAASQSLESPPGAPCTNQA